jgi:hypothetical protein
VTGVAATPRAQTAALLGLRWQMIRTPGIKFAIGFGVVVLVWLLQLAMSSTGALEPAALATAVDLAPQAFLGFAVLAIIAPLTVGGGTQVVPPDQLVAFPVRPGTHFLGGLALAPVNLLWASQIVVLAAETAYLSADGHLLPGLLTALAFVAAITTVGQAFAWTLGGIRQTRTGRRLVLVTAVAGAVAAVAVIRAGVGGEVVDASPTRSVVSGITAGAQGDWWRWAITTLALLGVTAGSLVLGPRACAWSLQRPSDVHSRGESVGVRRRRGHRTALRELIALDRASVWRAPALRRGGLVLAITPGVAAACAQVPWESLVVLPGLVAAGAGLLFGVNAFSLDGSGALWLAGLPHDPRLVLWSKAIVLTETVVGAAVLAGLSGSIRSPGSPSLVVVVAIGTGTVVCSAFVIACSLSLSVTHPHKADLRGPRDSIAPPGALVVASVRLAVPAAVTCVLLESATRTGTWWLSPVVALPLALSAVRHARRVLRVWGDPVARARVVQVVSAG